MATAGPVVETVSRKRIVPTAELEAEKPGRTTPDFWDFIEKMTDEMWAGDYILYIMREDPKPSLYGGTNTLEKCPGRMVMPNGIVLKLDSREDIELAIKEKWGGKAFRLILKKGRERLTEGKCMNDAQPKYPDNLSAAQNPLPHAAAATTDANTLVGKAMDQVANKDSEAINIAMSALRASADLIARQAAPPAASAANPAPAAASLDVEIDRAFKAALLRKLLEPPPPPPDPIDTFVKIKQALGDGNGGGSGPMNSIMEKFLTVAAEKVFNPPAVAAVTGRTTLLDIGRELVPVLSNVMHEYRLSREADARIAELSRTNPPPNAAQPAVPIAPAPIPEAAAPSAAAQNPQPQPVPAQQPGPNFQWIASRVANIVKNMEYTTDQAVDEVLSFLYNTDERLPGMLLDPQKLNAQLKPGKEGLVQLFQFEPALASCMVNTPRVLEFIDKFLVAAKEAEDQEAKLRAAAPANAAPTPTS